MKDIINKRKIKCMKTLNGKFLHNKSTSNIPSEKVNLDPKIIQNEIVNNNITQEKKEPKFKISPFQLVVIKLPWYKRAIRSFMNLFGLYYEF